MASMRLWNGLRKKKTIAAFKDKHIYPSIVETELHEKSMVNWMATLYIHDLKQRLQETKSAK